MEKAKGTIIRLTKLTDTSLIVTWMTEEHGLIKTVAKGARRANSNFAGKLDLYHRAELEFILSSKSELHTLKELAILNFRENLRKDYYRVLLASYFTRLLEMVAEREIAAPELADLLERALDFLVEKPASKKAMLHFEKQLASLLGLGDRGTYGYKAIVGLTGTELNDRLQILTNISDLH